MPKRKRDSGDDPVVVTAAEPVADEEDIEDSAAQLDEDAELDLDGEFEEESGIDLGTSYGQGSGPEPTIRRALEEMREARRMRDDLDYLDVDD
ncbi:MAG: hypothetical protein ACR2PZ_18020 [Pseudomonadales bacterium]